MKKFAVIGSPISHSLSPQIHSLFAEQAQIEISYEAIEIIESDFNSKVNQLFEDGYSGLNVTLPLKKEAFNYLEIFRCFLKHVLREEIFLIWETH